MYKQTLLTEVVGQDSAGMAQDMMLPCMQAVPFRRFYEVVASSYSK